MEAKSTPLPTFGSYFGKQLNKARRDTMLLSILVFHQQNCTKKFLRFPFSFLVWYLQAMLGHHILFCLAFWFLVYCPGMCLQGHHVLTLAFWIPCAARLVRQTERLLSPAVKQKMTLSACCVHASAKYLHWESSATDCQEAFPVELIRCPSPESIFSHAVQWPWQESCSVCLGHTKKFQVWPLGSDLLGPNQKKDPNRSEISGSRGTLRWFLRASKFESPEKGTCQNHPPGWAHGKDSFARVLFLFWGLGCEACKWNGEAENV